MALPRTFDALRRYLARDAEADRPIIVVDTARGPDERWPAIIQSRSPESCHRARTLLRRFLNPTQRKDFDATGAFVHHGKRGDYTIQLGRSYNVSFWPNGGGNRIRDDSEFPAIMCAIPEGAGAMPAEDIVLAQLLALRNDEAGFWRSANVSQMERPPRTRGRIDPMLQGNAANYAILDDPHR